MGGCQMETYLLEQSRVVAPPPGERNYHIFYHILEGASKEERALYKIGESNNEYAYTQGEAKSAGIDDKASWAEAKRQLELLGFSQVLITRRCRPNPLRPGRPSPTASRSLAVRRSDAPPRLRLPNLAGATEDAVHAALGGARPWQRQV
eukprot:3054018-Prymnesium_polylepis.1